MPRSGPTCGQGRKPLALYASIEDPKALQAMPSLRPFNLSTLATFRGEVAAAHLEGLPPGMLAVLLDQLVCARSDALILNAFSTFSQVRRARARMLAHVCAPRARAPSHTPRRRARPRGALRLRAARRW